MAGILTNFFSRSLPLISRRMERIDPQPVFTTERLILRPFLISDASDVSQLLGSPLIADVTASIPYPYPKDMAISWIEGHPVGWQMKDFICYAVVQKESGILVGSLSLMNIEAGSAELGYWYGVNFWGQGYATEAAQCLCRAACHEFGIKQLFARHLDRNPASGRVLGKVGFQYLTSEYQQLGIMPKAELMHLYHFLPTSEKKPTQAM